MDKQGKITAIGMIVLILATIGVIVWTCTRTATTENASLDRSNCRQAGSYFPDENRFVLVDESYQDFGGETYHCKVFADRYMYTMYLWMETGSANCRTACMTQIFYEDGYPMIYDDETLDMENELMEY